jgi:hypothetical protein
MYDDDGPRRGVLRCLHAIDATRVHRTTASGPSRRVREVASMASSCDHAPSRRRRRAQGRPRALDKTDAGLPLRDAVLLPRVASRDAGRRPGTPPDVRHGPDAA